MIEEILFVSISGLIVGIILAYILSKIGVGLPTKEDRKKNKILNNPDLLLEKLNKNGEMVDAGEKLQYSVVEEEGKKRLDLKKTPVEKESPPVGKEVKKQIKKSDDKPDENAH